MLHSAAEAVAYMRTMHALVRCLDICDGNMQEGSFRCDANVSVRRAGETKLGTRDRDQERSTRSASSRRRSRYEIERQIRAHRERRAAVVAGDAALRSPTITDTRPMRGKEDAHDYRYFPIPTCRR